MADAKNPMGTDGFEFVEFTSPTPDAMAATFERLGFTAVSKHPTKDVVRYKQNDINFLLNREPTGQGAEFRAAHGGSANAMGFRVADAEAAYKRALDLGAKPADAAGNSLEHVRALQGIGGSLLYLVEKDAAWAGWTPLPGAEKEAENEVGLMYLDHLTHNVHRGQMRTWSGFYGDVFNFEEQKYFDIKGKATGLFSQAMIAPDRKIRIPLNESQDDKSQIEEFLKDYGGEGIQHLALGVRDIFETVEELKRRGVEFQDTIETYYELIDKRIPGHGHDVERMKKNRILIDGSEAEGLLLQIFTANLFGPIFFEVIQRKGNEAFGEGNFQALFDSIELDQIRRGVIKVDA
ncbi:4-hydroxyphenylpyruvate dioxygenase [Caulobacter sp. 17J80-11]|uniref:4-hydroxyphenylpyruvate dioxygenase n=1 Tax=Caulobacter sp. 17J80-11 TaxID=2763502 RepID=UPI001653A0D5|nr:4-hydroxyphenylpyruvate dioxygenase [Caulobacter sp. 17J80-11]MBC6980392.1 4-hydroxyphenylpyruvate dioxygenase [Caulobacter sp. 17J80-11]